jgi:hypothetical protein
MSNANPAEFDPTDLVGQEEQREAKAAVEQIDRDRFVQDFKWFVGHKQGRRLMWWLLSQAGVFRNPWRPSANEMSFIAGNMNQGQMLLTELLSIAPESFTVMMKEANDDAKRRSGQRSE